MCAVASPESSQHAVAPSLLGFTGKQIAASQVVGGGRIRAEHEEGAATLEVISPREAGCLPVARRWSYINSGSQDERVPCGNGIAVPGDASSLPKGKEMTVA